MLPRQVRKTWGNSTGLEFIHAPEYGRVVMGLPGRVVLEDGVHIDNRNRGGGG